MAVKSSPSKPAARQPRPSNIAARPARNNDRFAHDLWGIGLVALGVVTLVSLAFQRHAGAVGDLLAGGLRALVGVGAFVVPPLLAAVGVMLIQGREQHTRTNFAGGAALLFFRRHRPVAFDAQRPRHGVPPGRAGPRGRLRRGRALRGPARVLPRPGLRRDPAGPGRRRPRLGDGYAPAAPV